MLTFEEKIRTAAAAEGIDLLGFADRERFDSVDPAHNPFTIFPEGKTVIMLGKRITRGSLRGVEEGTNFGDYSLFGKNWLEDEFLSLACYNLVRAIEDEGWEAVPIFPNPYELGPQGVPVAADRPAPNVYPDFDYAAVACGLGEIGLNGIFLSPELGSRQRFHMIITDAVLAPTPICSRTVCDRCGKCAAACPLGAIDATKTHTVTVCGKEMEVAEINYDLCRTCKNGACASRFGAGLKPDRVAALCNRTCLCHLEAEGLVDGRFENAFRSRAAWTVDASGRASESKDDEYVLGCTRKG